MATNLLSFPERLNDLKSINEFLNWAEISVSVYYCILKKWAKRGGCASEKETLYPFLCRVKVLFY